MTATISSHSKIELGVMLTIVGLMCGVLVGTGMMVNEVSAMRSDIGEIKMELKAQGTSAIDHREEYVEMRARIGHIDGRLQSVEKLLERR